MATLDPGGHVMWKEQIEVLKEFVSTLSGPLIIAGDLNTTRYRPEFEELLALGLNDAIDSLGKAVDPSFKLGADGLLGPVVRLDHALVNEDVRAVSKHELESCGSDHLPFIVEVAVRTRSWARATPEGPSPEQTTTVTWTGSNQEVDSSARSFALATRDPHRTGAPSRRAGRPSRFMLVRCCSPRALPTLWWAN